MTGNAVSRTHSRLISDKRYWSLFAFGVRVALCVHAFFILLFYTIGSPLMAIVNIGSVLLYTLCLMLLQKQQYLMVMIFC